jgi:5-(carboxyamino)imidazole ribonucleotide mutase
MPAGVPTATFSIGPAGATNAALFAIRMLAVNDASLRMKLAAYREAKAQASRASTRALASPAPKNSAPPQRKQKR